MNEYPWGQKLIRAYYFHIFLAFGSLYVLAYSVARFALHELMPMKGYEIMFIASFAITHTIEGPKAFAVMKVNDLLSKNYDKNLIRSDIDVLDKRLLIERCANSYLVRLESTYRPIRFKLMSNLDGFSFVTPRHD